MDGILAKRHIPYGQIIKISPVSGLKARDSDVCLGIELFCDASGDGIQFHAVQFAPLHFLRQHTEEVSHPAGGFQDVAGLESHFPHRLINGLDYGRAGVMGV